MHNNIMAAGSRDRPPMLGNKTICTMAIHEVLTYIDTRPNGDALRKCILKEWPRIANPLALVATAQTLQDPYYQTSKSHKSYAPTSKASLPTRSHATIRHKGKEIAKPITPPSESRSDEDSDLEQAQKKCKKIWLSLQSTLRNSTSIPTTTSELPQTPENKKCDSNSKVQLNAESQNRLKTPRITRKRCCCVNKLRKVFNLHSKQSELLAARMKRIDDKIGSTLQLHAKIQEVPNANSGTDAEPLEHVQYDTDDNVFANDIQHFDQSESISSTCAVETDDSNVTPDSPDMCDNDIQDDQNDVECDDERVALANLKLNVDENKKIQKQLKKANATLTQELTECKSILAKSRQAYNVMTNNINHLKEIVDQAWVKHSNDLLHLRNPTAQDMEILVKTCLMPLALKTQNDSFAFVHELKQEMHADLIKSFAKLEKHSISLEIALQECQEQLKNDTVCKEKASNVFRKEREQYFEIQDLKAQLQDKNIAISELKKLIEKCKGKSVDTKFDKPSVVRQPNAQRIPKPSVLGKPAPFSDSLERKYLQRKSMYRIASSTTQTRAPQLNQTSRNTNPRVSTSTGVTHNTNVSRPQPRSNQTKDKVVPNNSQVEFKKTEVEEHPRISSISNQTKSVTACNNSLKSRTSNVNAVCATCGKCVFNSNHDACVSKFLNDVNARTKKPNVVPISTRKPKFKRTNLLQHPIRKQLHQNPLSQIQRVTIGCCIRRLIVQLILFIVDSGCTKHMTGNLSLLCNFVEKYLGTVRFGNDQFAPILGYGDLVQGNITIKRVYYVEGLNHNLFSVGQFCDADLEVAFQKSTCFVTRSSKKSTY
ncbi:hypothetical protein Tco_0653788 [Tanacetum coccineum]|uniref:Retrovirus-related Pol polyprotein from transposon TNT 1-94-like beta-barrel domain-containing protein n=1 Tax=Tanacetum coccineum TaxID=301880 RepID=A0ABQ4X1J1_9ASTR